MAFMREFQISYELFLAFRLRMESTDSCDNNNHYPDRVNPPTAMTRTTTALIE